jgi:hypothetical protein
MVRRGITACRGELADAVIVKHKLVLRVRKAVYHNLFSGLMK